MHYWELGDSISFIRIRSLKRMKVKQENFIADRDDRRCIVADLHAFFEHLPDLMDGPDARFSFFNGLGATSMLIPYTFLASCCGRLTTYSNRLSLL